MNNKWKKLTAVAVSAIMCSGSLVGLTACDDPNAGVGKYTYRLATNSLPTSWNIHTYQSNDATYVLDYTEDSFYTFDYNDTKDGYQIVCSMAKEMPVDVSSSYVGEDWGIAEGDEWKAIRVSLKDNLYFENGDHITAKDFVDSIELLLNPAAANYRADSLYGGQFSLVNAEKYVKQGGYNYTAMVSAELNDWEYFDVADLVADENGILQLDGKDAVLNINSLGNWSPDSTYGLDKYYSAGYFDVEGWEEFAASADKDGYVKLNATGLKIVQDAIAQLQGYDNVEAYAEVRGDYAYQEWEEMAFFGYIWDEIDFSKVGVKAVDDYTLDFIIEKPLSGFYLKYNLTSAMYLVHVPTYKACMSESQGVYTNSYGTSKDTYVGFGPYKMSSYVADSVVTFEKNDKWQGYADAAENTYTTTNISIQQVTSENTRLNMFLNGELDSYGLLAADMDEYQSSPYTYFTEGDSTWFVALNPDAEKLAAMQAQTEPMTAGNEVNKTILTLKDFRMALSFSIDRAAYELALDPTGGVAKALYGNMIISDAENGVAYRTTDEAKKVITDFWGLTDSIGEGKEYETMDEAIASITGYDLAGAKKLFDSAYDQAVEQGLISAEAAASGKFEVQIMIGQPGNGSSAYYNDGYEFLKKTWEEAVKGTKLEGKLVFKQSQPLGSTSFASYLQNCTVDLLFGVGWTGSALDPYSLMEAYVSPNYQYDPAWNTTQTMLDVEINGQVLRSNVLYWGQYALQGTEIPTFVVDADGNATDEMVKINAGPNADPAVRLAILAAVEGAVLNQYDMIPVGTQASANLKGMRVQYYTEEYVFGMARGGIKYMTYSMDDAEWNKFVKSNGGTLNYKG
ncbi:MAG: hypothetical protein J5993_01905 [Clostridia bacterium]|nr:hypothetical protein [Clostridia bacterium]